MGQQPDEPETWIEDRKYVMAQITRHEQLIHSLGQLHIDLAVLKAKLAAYAAAAGFLAGLFSSLVGVLLKLAPISGGGGGG